jgi:hypothetical protein
VTASIDWASFLAKPGISEAIEAQSRQARAEVHYAYQTLDLLGTEAAILGHGLRAEREYVLATPVALVATVIRQQVEMATGTEWFPGATGGGGGGGAPDLGLEDLNGLPSLEAAEALGEEVHSLAVLMAAASDCVPRQWGRSLCRCLGSLFSVVAHLQDAVETVREERRQQAPNTEET